MTTKLEDLEINRFLARGELLAQLQGFPAWEGWVALLKEMRQSALEELARCSDAGDFRYWQGVAGALGEVLDRPIRIVQSAADYQRTEESETRTLRPDLRAAIGMGIDPEGSF